MSLSLTEYAKANPTKGGGKDCWLCGLPERAEVEEAARNGVLQTVIVRWLKKEKGYAEATIGKVKNHLQTHVAR